MESSIKQWHKSLLFSCVALALLVNAAPANAQTTPPPPDEWDTQIQYVLNVYTAINDDYLVRLGFWNDTDQPNLDYEIGIYDSFSVDGGGIGQVSDLLRSVGGSVTNYGYHAISLPQLKLELDKSYYLVLGLSGGDPQTYPKYGYYDSGATGVGYYHDHASGTYDFGDDGGLWRDWGVTWAINVETVEDDPNPPTKNIAITGHDGDWSIESEVYDAQVDDSLLTVDISATDHGPYDTEITVTGGMEAIVLDGTVTNNSGVAWLDGYYLQLGYGLGEDFELATDGLAFGFPGEPHELFFADPIDIGEPVSVDGGFPINMGDHNVFTLRQFAVPEPSSLMLLALSGLALLAMGRRRR